MDLTQLKKFVAREPFSALLLVRAILFFGALWVISWALLALGVAIANRFDPTPIIGNVNIIDVLGSIGQVNPFKSVAVFIVYSVSVVSLYFSYRIATLKLIDNFYLRARALGTGSPANLTVETPGVGIPRLIADIEHRVGRLQARSNLIIAIVIVSLVSAVFLIVFAGRLTSIDAAAVSSVQSIKEEMATLDRQISELGAQSARISQQQKTTRVPEQTPITRTPAESDPEILAVGIRENKEFLMTRRKAIAELLDKAWNNELNETTKDKLKDTNFLTATIMTRVGVLVILVFLVQILISLYKYNTRMIAFYASRLDCLRVWGGNVRELQTLLPLLTPAHVDFGPDAKHPVQYIVDAWRQRKGGGAGQKRPGTRRTAAARGNQDDKGQEPQAPQSGSTGAIATVQ
jgi:hypothetical protein